MTNNNERGNRVRKHTAFRELLAVARNFQSVKDCNNWVVVSIYNRDKPTEYLIKNVTRKIEARIHGEAEYRKYVRENKIVLNKTNNSL